MKFLAWMHERIPMFIIEIGEQQTLDGAAARDAASEQPRRKHFGVVDDEQITLPKKLRKL
jgi:hypothetical protein